MAWTLALLLACSAWLGQSNAKQLFYDARGGGAQAAAPGRGLRPITIAPHEVNGGGRLPVGMHFWFETESGAPISQRAASATPGKYTLHVRHNNEVPAFLSVWQVNGEARELTPRTNSRWSGYSVVRYFHIPGTFEFQPGDAAPRMIIVLARSATELPQDAANARERLGEIPRFFSNITETDESTPGQIGTYVISRTGGPAAAEITLRSFR